MGYRLIWGLCWVLSGAMGILGGMTTALAAPPELLLVVGAPGESQYEEQFRLWAQAWWKAAAAGKVSITTVGLADVAQADSAAVSPPSQPDLPRDTSAAVTDREQLSAFLSDRRWRETMPADAAGQVVASGENNGPLWIVLIGHGTYDGRSARFNLRGPDFSADELATWLQGITRPLVVINTTSCSGPFLPVISAPGRVVVTATENGDDQQFARLAGMLSESIVDPAADLDKDDQTSLLEAIVFSSRKVARFYAEESRLATEHALLDDNGDKMGTPLAWFQGTMATAQATTDHDLDGNLAHQWHFVAGSTEQKLTPSQLARRAELEQQLYDLRRLRPQIVDEESYYRRMEPILLEIAQLYQAADQQP